MPAERTTMRQVREILRLKFVGGVPIREIVGRLDVAPSTVRVTLKRFAVAGPVHRLSEVKPVARGGSLLQNLRLLALWSTAPGKENPPS